MNKHIQWPVAKQPGRRRHLHISKINLAETIRDKERDEESIQNSKLLVETTKEQERDLTEVRRLSNAV